MSSRSGTTTAGPPDPERLRAAIDLVVARLQPDQIILFGSAARNEMSPWSDLDLLVIKERRPDEPQTDHTHWECDRTGDDIDVILMDRATAENGRRSASCVQGAALTEGHTVYTREGVKPVLTGPTCHWNGHEMVRNTLFEPDHAHELVAQAEERWRNADEGELSPAYKCEILQAAMERALKALITARGQRVNHRHDLNKLWEEAEEHGERINARRDPDELEKLSRYAGDWQYDTPRDADPEKTWAAARLTGEDLLNDARKRVPQLVHETTQRLKKLEAAAEAKPTGAG